MSKPLNKRWFGLPSNDGFNIVVSGVKFADGATFDNAYIIKQTGTSRYLVQDVLKNP